MAGSQSVGVTVSVVKPFRITPNELSKGDPAYQGIWGIARKRVPV